jgi:hypothetical protein
MKKTLSILLLVALLPVISLAQGNFFPIGGFNPPMVPGIMPGADSCGINIMGLLNMPKNETEARLSEMQAL